MCVIFKYYTHTCLMDRYFENIVFRVGKLRLHSNKSPNNLMKLL